MHTIKKAAILGGGVLGGGWLARLIENGVEVSVYDPDRQAERKLGAVLANAERAMAKLTMAPRGAKGAWALAGSVAAAVAGAELIVEAVPERLDLTRRVYAEVGTANANRLLPPSTAALLPTASQAARCPPAPATRLT